MKINKIKKLQINNKNNTYNFTKAITLLKKITTKKFIESIEISLNLGINTNKSEQNIKGYIILPYTIGKNRIIAAFVEPENTILAKKSGAEYVGLEDLCEKIQKKKIKFDIVIATPKTMPIVGKLGTILGPKGLMPNIKFGTITNNIKNTIKNIKAGQIFYKNDKNGIIHANIGKINLKNKKLKKNFQKLILEIKKQKPNKTKGLYIKKIYLSSTMGPSIQIKNDKYN